MKTTQVGWRLRAEIVEELQRLADADQRSISSFVNIFLANALKSPSPFPLSNGFPPALYDNNISPPSLTLSPSSPPKNNTPKNRKLDPRFEEFWQEYPRKTGKEAARRAWEKASARVGADTILAGLRAALWPSDSQFIPHPATWLNQGRWDDEAPPARPRDEDMIPL